MQLGNNNGRLFEFENTFFDNPKPYDFVDVWQIGELSLESGYEMFAHPQACHEICFIISGEGMFYTDDQAFSVKTGDIHYIPRGKVHRIIGDKNQNLRFAYFGFEFNEKVKLSELHQMVEIFEHPPAYLLRDTGNVRLMIYMLINEMYGKPHFSDIMVEAYIKQILVQVYRLFISEKANVFVPETSKNVISKPIYSVISYIDNHIFEIDKVKSISEKLGYSQCYLSHLFKEKMGITLQRYLTTKKIETSLNLLSQHKYSITQIASMLHYESAQSFGKVFKKFMRCTPSEYRSRLGNGQ